MTVFAQLTKYGRLVVDGPSYRTGSTRPQHRALHHIGRPQASGPWTADVEDSTTPRKKDETRQNHRPWESRAIQKSQGKRTQRSLDHTGVSTPAAGTPAHHPATKTPGQKTAKDHKETEQTGTLEQSPNKSKTP